MPHLIDSSFLESQRVRAIVEDFCQTFSMTDNGLLREALLFHTESEFESEVVSQLGILSGCTPSDLTEILRSQYLGDAPTSDSLYSRYTAAVTSAARAQRRSSAIAIEPAGRLTTNPERPWKDIEVWRSDDQRFAVTLIGLLPCSAVVLDPREYCLDELHGAKKQSLYISIEGVSTEQYFSEFCDSVENVLSTLVRCLILLNMRLFADIIDDAVALAKKIGRGLPVEYGNRFSDYFAANTIIKDGMLTPHFAFAKDALSLYFFDLLPVRKKATSTISGRIRNSVALMMEADRQPNNGVGLALSVSAIESLISTGKDDVSREFSEIVARLLEPDLDYRVEAEKWIKRIYDRRSKLLHGTELDCGLEESRHARLVAAAILKAFLERYAAMKRIGNDETLTNLLAEIKSDKYRQGGITHVDT